MIRSHKQKDIHFGGLASAFSLLLLIAVTLALYSCGNGDGEGTTGKTDKGVEPEGWDRLIQLEDTLLMIDIPAVTVKVGRDTDHLLSLTILKSQIREGYQDQSIRRNATARMLASIRSGQNTYTEMADRDTYVRVKVPLLDPEREEAEIRIEARLVDSNTNNRYFEVKTTVNIRGEQFKRLVE